MAERRRQVAVDEAPSLAAWLRAGISQVGLAPLPEETRPRPATYLPSALDDGDDDAQPYALAAPMKLDRGRVRAHDFAAVRLWRREVGALQKVFRWLNESAYFASVPFLLILLFGTAVKSRPLALLGATVVVLLNIGRAAAGAVNLVLVPLRDGLDLARLKKPVRRVAEPILTIALVVAAFSFIPWLSAGHATGGSVARSPPRRRLRAGDRHPPRGRFRRR